MFRSVVFFFVNSNLRVAHIVCSCIVAWDHSIWSTILTIQSRDKTARGNRWVVTQTLGQSPITCPCPTVRCKYNRSLSIHESDIRHHGGGASGIYIDVLTTLEITKIISMRELNIYKKKGRRYLRMCSIYSLKLVISSTNY